MTADFHIPLKFNFLLLMMLVLVSAMIVMGCATQQKSASVPSEEQTQRPPQKPQTNQQTGTPGETQSAEPQQQREKDRESQKTAGKQLEAAREKLRVSQDTESKVQAEFEKLKQSGQVSTQVARDYQIYLDRIESLVSENQAIVEKLEAAAGNSSQGRELDTSQGAGTDDNAELDRRLNQALAEFDEMLLQEMENIQAQSAPKMTSLAEEAAAAAERLRNKGVDLGTAGDQTGKAPSEEDGARENEDSDGGSESETEANAAKGSGVESEAGGNESRQAKTESGGNTEGTASSDRSAGFGDDDDIVARQLREAAENETDPELKEKLWKEYEDYKKNTRR